MGFSTHGGYNLGQRDRLPDYVQAPPEGPYQETWLDKLATGAGQGLGTGIQKQIADRLESSALDRALGTLRPGMSVMEQHQALSGASPESRAYFNANIAPQMQKEQEYTAKRQQGSALAGILSGTGGQQGSPIGVPGQQQTQGNQQSQNLEDLPPEQMQAVMATLDPAQQIQLQKVIAERKKNNLDERKFANDERVRKIRSQEEVSTPILKEAHEARHATEARLHAANEMIASTEAGNLGLGKDYIADLLHAENLRTPQGARFKSAQKEALISGINKVPGGRPNMWVEQQVASAIPQIGRSREANLISGLGMKAGADTDKLYIDELDRLGEQYRNDPQYGYVPANIEAQVMKNIAPQVQHRQDLLAYQIRRVHEKENPKSLLSLKHVPYGTPLTVKKAEFFVQKANGDLEAAEKMAQQFGYTIPSDEFIEQGDV